MYDSEPEIKDLIPTVADLALQDWQDIGYELNLEESTIKQIEMNYTRASDACREMLLVWLKRETTPTWATLLQALKCRKRQDVINAVIKHLESQ